MTKVHQEGTPEQVQSLAFRSEFDPEQAPLWTGWLLPTTNFAVTRPADSYRLSIVMNKDRIGGLFFLFVGLCFFSFSVQLPLGKITQPGPAVFPFFLSLLLSIIGLAIFFSVKKEKQTSGEKDSERLGKPLAIILLTLGFILFMGRLGYLAASFGYLFCLFYLVSRYKLIFSAGLSGILAAGTWYFFGKILGIFLPMGPWNI